jgi:hypothetical protein
MKRTTVRLDDDLMARVKEFALRNGTTIQRVIEDGLQLLLSRRRPAEGPRPRIVTFKGTGLRPGVDLDDNAALLDLMEEDDHRPV